QALKKQLFMAIYINELKNRSNHKIASKQLPNGKYWDPCFLPTPFGLRANIILRTNGFIIWGGTLT
ncbi:MAG: hypothetical protein Q8O31_05555, partial [Rhodocyclaceae bacterium]|nr:hypothetical protein [Rhodocyclaceae bacterium]